MSPSGGQLQDHCEEDMQEANEEEDWLQEEEWWTERRKWHPSGGKEEMH